MARVLIVLLCVVVAQAADYLWPLPDSRTLTGGHADSRTDHFHGGVDLRARTPLRVVAPTDGWIERVAINPPGYGRTLYYRLSDGRTAVFGHLSRYEPQLQATVRDSQLAVGTYRIDVSYDEANSPHRYSAGDVICYTGASGRGPAHLHFEIRDGATQLDPLMFFEPRDHDDPAIVGVSWIKFSDDIPSAAGRSLALNASPRVESSEPVAFLVRTYDPGPWGRNAVPRFIRVYADEQLIFEDRSSEINLQGPQSIYAKLVYPEFKTNDRDVRRLFLWPERGTRDEQLPAGWLDNFTGVVRIEVEDRNGNTSSVRIPVQSGAQRSAMRVAGSCESNGFSLSGDNIAMSWADLLPVGDEVHIRDDNFALPAKLVLTADQAFEPGKYFYKRSGATGKSAIWRIPADDTSTMSCYVLRGGTYGIAYDDTPPRLTLSGQSGQIKFTLADDESSIDDSNVRCTVDGQTAIPEYEYEEDGGTIWTPQKLGSGKHKVQFTAANRAGLTKTWDITVTIP